MFLTWILKLFVASCADVLAIQQYFNPIFSISQQQQKYKQGLIEIRRDFAVLFISECKRIKAGKIKSSGWHYIRTTPQHSGNIDFVPYLPSGLPLAVQTCTIYLKQ